MSSASVMMSCFCQMPLSGGGARKIDQFIDLIERGFVRSSTSIAAALKDQ